METATNELDLGALLPSVGSVLGLIKILLVLAMLAGPLLQLGFGLLYWFKPPQEANYGLGYRFWWGMSSLDAWKFTQLLAGKVFTVMGGALTLIAIVVSIIIGGLELEDMANWAAICVLIELVLIGLGCLAINILVMLKFDKDGYRRDEEYEE
ncbi:MAG: SdpI family protein [Ruminococcaceae bacterium]|nr:SdpI family protein [Oscillospiraceae bacterium]